MTLTDSVPVGSWLCLVICKVSNTDPTLPRIAVAVLLAGGSSRAMLASARLSCCLIHSSHRVQSMSQSHAVYYLYILLIYFVSVLAE